jgi:ATP-dependent Lon protease
VAEGERGPFVVNCRNLHKFLGVPKFLPEMEQDVSEVGVATGLAWTQAGGETLYVEASVMKGKGELMLTGQLGDIMQESARAAVSYARANAGRLGIPVGFYQDRDIHIHVPAGAIPKDGPSAGITMAMALVSALSGRPVSRDVAMTGEISLRGRLLPVGGVKEKVLAARRAKVKTVILPKKNEKDLLEIPKPVRRKLSFIPAGHITDVLDLALEPKPSGKKRGKAKART